MIPSAYSSPTPSSVKSLRTRWVMTSRPPSYNSARSSALARSLSFASTTGAASRNSGASPVRFAVAQSSANTTRSPASGGSSRRRPLRSRNEYSSGRPSSPERYITLSLPSRSSASLVPRMEPNASPSGVSCITRRKRSLMRIASATAVSSLVTDELVDQLGHANALCNRSIVFEGQLRGPLHSQLASDAGLENTVGGGQPVNGGLLLSL